MPPSKGTSTETLHLEDKEHRSNAMANLLSGEVREPDPIVPPRRPLSSKIVNDKESIIGGIPPTDMYKTTAQMLCDDNSHGIRRNSKRPIGNDNNFNTISPITFELNNNYGDWREKPTTDVKNEAWPEYPTEECSNLMLLFREKLKAMGGSGIIGLGRKFKIMDDDKSGSLSFTEFNKAIKESQLSISDIETKELFLELG